MLLTAHQVDDTAPDLMNRTEATAYLGYPRGMLRHMEEIIPFSKVGGMFLYKKNDLDQIKERFVRGEDLIKIGISKKFILYALSDGVRIKCANDYLYLRDHVEKTMSDLMLNFLQDKAKEYGRPNTIRSVSFI